MCVVVFFGRCKLVSRELQELKQDVVFTEALTALRVIMLLLLMGKDLIGLF